MTSSMHCVIWHDRAVSSSLYGSELSADMVARKSVVVPAIRSKSAKQKDATRRTPEDLSVQSFQDLLMDMATLTRNSIRFESSASEFHQLTEFTTLQRRALELLSTHA